MSEWAESVIYKKTPHQFPTNILKNRFSLDFKKFSNMRIIQKRLVYVIGLSGNILEREVLFY